MEYIVFQINGGIGKNVIATAVTRAINIQYPDSKIIILTAHPDIWLNNPRIHRVFEYGKTQYFYDEYINNKDSLIFAQEPYLTPDCIYKRKHLSEIWCEMYNLRFQGEKPELYFTVLEKDFVSVLVNKKSPILLIQPFGGAQTTHKYSWMRDMSPRLAQGIVDEFKKNDYRIIQIKREDQMGLTGVDFLTQNPRILALALFFSDRRVLIDSYLQHAAAALDLPSTVLWIGNSPITFGYNLHKNITTQFVIGNTRDSLYDPFDITGNPIQLGTSPNNLFDLETVVNLIRYDVEVEEKEPEMITLDVTIPSTNPTKKSNRKKRK